MIGNKGVQKVLSFNMPMPYKFGSLAKDPRMAIVLKMPTPPLYGNWGMGLWSSFGQRRYWLP